MAKYPEIEAFVNREKEKGRREGIATGLRIAERIAQWWRDNHKLKEPHSIETLNAWTNDALNQLRTEL